ncbi:TlyA family rRNA (cytidine-2'-O)-methyltransferase [Candidatus Woesebacteria bacterium]|nr:TlyA family rRNA (cytidine-2'-O)-methyltransferase [Candidatus Woesebacteria bacterium]
MVRFVSRSGEKLQFALKTFKTPVKDEIVADFGSSTGGFVECLLQHGAKKVYAVEVGYGTLDWKLRNDPRVVVMEKTNAMHVTLPENVDLITIDVGWTKQKNILPNAFANLKKDGYIISLIKPHYEANPKLIRKGKLLSEYLDEILENVKKDITAAGGRIVKIIESPILGGRAQNREFLALIV